MQRSSLANDKMNETGSQPGKRGDFAMNGKKSLFVFMIILGAVMAYVQPAEAVNRYWVAASAGNWSNTANWSNATGGAGGQPVPVAGDTANFDSGGAGTCTLDTSPTVTAINMASTFAGTFDLSSSTLTVSGGFTFSGGTLTASTSTVILSGGSSTVTGNITFYNLTINGTSGADKTVANSNTLTVNNTLVLTVGRLVQATVPAAGTIAAKGDITQASTFAGASSAPAGASVVISGSGNQTFTGSATSTTGDMPVVTINKSSGTLFLSGIIRTTHHWNYTAGTLDVTTNSNKVVFAGSGSLKVTGSHTLRDVEFYAGDGLTIYIADNNTLTVSRTLTLTDGKLAQTTVPAAGSIIAQGDIIQASTYDGSYSAGVTIVVSGTGNQTFTGSATSTTGDMPAVTINKSSGTLFLSGTIRTTRAWTYTAGTLDVTTNSNKVVFAGGGLTITGSHTLRDVEIYLNSSTCTIANNNTLTVSGTLTLTGGSLTQTTVPAAGTIAAQGDITVASTWNGAGGGGPGTIVISGTGNQTLTGSATSTVGNLAKLTINKSSGTLTLAGTIRTSNNWTYTAGTLDAGTSTVVFVPTGSGLTMAGNHSLYNVRIDSNSATNSFILTVPATLTVLGTLTFGNSSTGSINVNGGAINANGNITVENNVNYGGGAATLTINGNGNQALTGSATSTTGNIPAVTINKSSGTLTLAGTIRTSNNWTYTAGTLDAGTSTVVFVPTASPGLTIAGNHSLYNVRIDSNSATNSFILTVPATLTVLGTLTFGNSSTGSINVNGGAINANGNITVENNVNYGGGAATLTINGTGNQIVTGPSSGTTTIPSITVSKSSGSILLGSTVNFGGSQNLTINSTTTLDLAGYPLTVGGTLTNNGIILASGGGDADYCRSF